ncbi:hypothetical protein GLX30_14625 [Streptomyces sp. Tu 2975]|uniref:hypothetical protein n=1 Tax=Streptomyces sp. Tu 2975 TaxID=2676871 RepID=UPI0013578FFE|nr:hypothetical protein [Streptomyces sp. Tu 2975]QIP85054.1 hypothetical protein GLX30_14625 [Streptomyces sp. Tu 2975]
MNENAEKQPLIAAPSYASGQLTKAFTTALTHQDAGTRTRAQQRMRRWRDVLDGMADGRLRIGSRTPVAGLPAWVTPEVVHGGFATGSAAAGGPLLPYETEAAREAGVPADRRALFDHFLTEPGLVTLWDLLDSGRYSVAVPEEAALLTVAWLVRAGEVPQALELVGVLDPFAGRLRFLPRPSDVPAPDTLAVHRRTVADVGHTLARRGTNTAVETQREALTVWLPFADELLAHWLETTGPGEIPADGDWLERGAELLRRYRLLAQEHTLCGKHRRPKENLAVLRDALEEAVAGRPLAARRLGLLRHAVTSMVRKRGTPGTERHTALRHRQAGQAALPSHHALAQVVLRRVSGLPQHVGAADIAPLVTPVTQQEHRDTGLPVGAEIPAAIRQVVEAALSAPIGTLVERGVVPSAEVLAELVPQLVAATTAQAYEDESLRTLMAAVYRAFRNRRSLLLLDLERQARIEELPWVQAVAGRRLSGPATEEPAMTALRRLGELAVQAFPGTLLPNPLVRELGVLARQADLGAALVEELAADIFMGTFGPKFLRAARDAAELLRGSLYERYYGIDYAAVRNMAVLEAGEALTRSYGARTSPGFARLCTERAGRGGYGSVAANGKIIEQAQILTTHNLATLVRHAGILPEPGWADLACRCFSTVCVLTARVHGNPRPLGTIKDVAYAWRQMLFHLSLCTADEQQRVLGQVADEAARHPRHVAARLAPALAGLRLVAAGGSFGGDGTADGGRARRLLGWSTDGHWLRPDPSPGAGLVRR